MLSVESTHPALFVDPFAPASPLNNLADSGVDAAESSVEDAFVPLAQLDGVAVSGVSPAGMAFVYAWYGDALRLFKLLPALESRHVDSRNLRWGLAECISFTTDEAAPDFTLVHVAAVRGHFELVRRLAGYGVPVDDRGALGWSPSPLELLLDRDGRSFETIWPDRETFNKMVALLLELGAKPTSRSALLHPINADDELLLEMLLRAGADPNRPLHMFPSTPLLAACGSPDLVRILLRYGADPHATNDMGLTVFDFATVMPGLGAVLQELGGKKDAAKAAARTSK